MTEAEHAPSPVELLRGRMVGGFLRVLAAESLGLPTGIIILGVLARKLSTADFGLFTLAFAIVTLAELLVVSLVARTATKAVSEAEAWHPVGDAVLMLYTVVATAACLLLALAAPSISVSLDLPALRPLLTLLALDLVPFGLVRGHRDLLVGTGRFQERANAAAVGLVARMLLTVLLVLVRPSVSSAIFGTIGGTLVELAYCRYRVKPRLFARRRLSLLPVRGYLVPVFIATGAELALARIDVVLLKWLGAASDQVAVYGAAQRLALIPGLYAMAIAAPLLSTLGLLVRKNERQAAADLAREAVRFGLLALPFVALIAGAATELAVLILGSSYAAAGPILALLIFAAFARVLVVVANVLLLAADRSRLAAGLAIVTVTAALVAYRVLIPRFGSGGAAAVTLGASVLLALGGSAGAVAAWRTRFPSATLARSVGAGALGFALARLWPANGGVVVLKLAVLGALVPIGYYLLGEWSRRDLEAVRALWRGRRYQEGREGGPL